MVFSRAAREAPEAGGDHGGARRQHRAVARGRHLLADRLRESVRGAGPRPEGRAGPAAVRLRAGDDRAVRPGAAGEVRRRHRPADALVHDQPRVDQEGDRPQRPLRLQQPLVDPVEREAHLLRGDDAAGAAGARDLDAAGEEVRARRRPGADAAAVRADVLAGGDRREDRLSVLHEALPRRRLARRDQDRRPRRVPEGLRRQRHGSHEPAEGGDPLRLVRALHRARAADAQGELRPVGGAARPLHDGHAASCRRRTRRCSRT